MRIANSAYRYQTQTQKGAARSGLSGSGSFGRQLDITAAKRNTDQLEVSTSGTAWQNVREMELSPYCKLMDIYNAWKAQQPPQDLPDSWGPTEENLAYLKKHYTGDLTWEERVDALETMVQMGVITRDQRNDAMGGGMTTFKPTGSYEIECVTVESLPVSPANINWDESLKDYTASTFKTADDLFSWLDDLLADENV